MQDKDPALPHNLIPSPCRFYPSPTSSRAADENLSSFSPVQWVLFHSALSRFASFLESYWYPELRNAGNLGGKSTSILLPFDRQATMEPPLEDRPRPRVAGELVGVGEASTSRAAEPRTAIGDIMHAAIADRVFPGGVVTYGRLGRKGEVLLERTEAFGTFTFESNVPVQSDSIFDLASLTKVVATATSVLMLVDRGVLRLDDLVRDHLPEFGTGGKENVTIRQLLTHSAGYKAWYNFNSLGLDTKERVLGFVQSVSPVYDPGTDYWYSDLSMIALGALVEALAGEALDAFASRSIFRPLGMHSTGFRPIAGCEGGQKPEPEPAAEGDPGPAGVVPTEVDGRVRKRLLWGEVHDLNASLMGGVAGHAGLFSSGPDLAKFCCSVLRRGVVLGSEAPLYSELASETFLRRLTDYSPYGFGWNHYGDHMPAHDPKPSQDAGQQDEKKGEEDGEGEGVEGEVEKAKPAAPYRSGGRHLSPSAVGHLGFTGTSVWVDPANSFYVVLLTNAVHPDAGSESGARIREVRPAVADAAFETCFPERFGRSGGGRDGEGERAEAAVASLATGLTAALRRPGRWRRVRDLACFAAVCLWSLV